jgi:hypothetical protein
MKPPICCICYKNLDDSDDGGLIYFKKRTSDKKWDKLMKENDMVGHPPYAEWFCKEHFEKADELRDLSIDRALKLLKP